MTTTTAPPVPEHGHPRGLYMLFFAEMWERFCYYGMRALLVFYVAEQFATGEGGASLTYGAYTALVYATAILGGWVADAVLGYRKSIILGGLLMAGGEFLLIVPERFSFLAGLTLMVVGTGLFKPNVSTLVGMLYPPGDMRRDQGFTIFYMGINLGAVLGTTICGYVGETYGWRWGFLAAGIAILLGILTFGAGTHRLGQKGLAPEGRGGARSLLGVLGGVVAVGVGVYFLLSKEQWMFTFLSALLAAVVLLLLGIGFRGDRVQRERMIGLVVLLFANIFFWAMFEQAGSSLNFFAKNYTDRNMFGFEFKATWFQNVNPLCIILLAPLFVLLWKRLEAAKANPSIPIKFGLGIVPLGLGFGVLLLGIRLTPSGQNTHFIWLILLYALHTAGELCLSPVGLSAMTKLAPERVAGLVMGAWFLSVSVGNYAAGRIAEVVGSSGGGGVASLQGYLDVFGPAMWASFGVGAFFLLIGPFVNKLLHGVR